ncbi:MAG: hypothetical protein ACOYMN_25865, partial [Roseimicrobium sp.]
MVPIVNTLASPFRNHYLAINCMLTSQDPNPSERRSFVLWRPFIAAWHWLFPPTQAHADRQSRAARMVAAVAVIVVCLAAVGVTVANGRKWHDQWQRWQSDRLVAQAEGLEKEERLL